MKTIAIIPCMNESQHIAKVVAETKKFVDAVIVVDDGSSDATSAHAAQADYVLRHIINLGKGAAMKTGCQKAVELQAETIIMIDGDGQHNPADIPKFIKLMEDNALDLVVGKRTFNKGMPFIFKLGNTGLNMLFTLLFGLHIEDTQSGFRAIRASVLPKIDWTSHGYAVETEMLAHAGAHGLKCQELPIETVYLDSVKGTTVFDGLKIGIQMLKWRLGW